MSTEHNHDISQQGLDELKHHAKKAGKATGRVGNRLLTKSRRTLFRAGQKAGRAVGKAIYNLGKVLTSLLIKLVVLLGSYGVLFCLCLVLLGGCFAVMFEERGSTGSNDLYPEVQNPSYRTETGILTAAAMTEPQAVIDAYYKMLSCSSYTKVYDAMTFAFNNTETTEDFAGLRDYNKRENTFYLSDDFLRCVDALLHDEDLYYPEQIVKPVYGQVLKLEDENHVEGQYYTARLPFDTSDGDMMLDTEHVKDFERMYMEGMEVDGASSEINELLPQSQLPIQNEEKPEYYELIERNVIADAFQEAQAKENGVNDKSDLETKSGLWDYGLGSVLEYQPEEKLSYIDCTYGCVDFGVHYDYYVWGEITDENSEEDDDTGGDNDSTSASDNSGNSTSSGSSSSNESNSGSGGGSGNGSDDSNSDDEDNSDSESLDGDKLAGGGKGDGGPQMGWILVADDEHWGNVSMPCAESVAAYQTACVEYCNELTTTTNAGLTDAKYEFYPGDYASNLEAIHDDTKLWNATIEYNGTEEATYTDKAGNIRHYKNEQVDARITDAWDKEISSIQFKNENLEEDFGNTVLLGELKVPTKLFPLNIAITNHASTFSGNIHYTIIPAGEEGCIKTEVELKQNTVASNDIREPVVLVNVTGVCANAASTPLTASRSGDWITMLPKITEVDSPWGFEYLQEYSSYYRGYVPEKFVNDRYFFLRSGISMNDNFSDNLKFLMELDLLHLYNKNIRYEAVGSANVEDVENTSSDLSVLSRFIAATAGSDKLEQLMVGAVFANRVQSTAFPNSFLEVLQSFGTDRNVSQFSVEPDDTAITSAMQVLNGQFSIPSNVLYCGEAPEGNIYTAISGTSGTRYFTTASTSESYNETDRFNRPATDPSQLQELANSLTGMTKEQAAVQTHIDYPSTVFIGDTLMDGLDAAIGFSTNGAIMLTEDNASILRFIELVSAQEGDIVPEDLTGGNGSENARVKSVYVIVGASSAGLEDSVFQTQYQALIGTI
ncbi:MAG: hypothetical protein IKC03_04050, partial [Oscillospiraceae bacterium]|nr:hypothetical protein [Oscillospiraceae bacterium]